MTNLKLHPDPYDVVVVGCGAGGSVVAKELGEAGMSVVVLDAGPRFNPERDYRSDRPDFPVGAWKVFEPADPRQDLYTAGPQGFRYVRVKGIGGTTVVSWGVSPRLHESDFRVRSLDGVAEDWPIGYADLEPYYTRVEYELGMSGPEGAERNPFDSPRSQPFPTPPHRMTRAGEIVAQGARKLGLHPFVPALAIPTKSWGGRPACVEAGVCGYGCRISAKSSADVTYVRKAEATGRVTILECCMAREITIDSSNKARSVIFLDREGREQEVWTRAVVLAANAIETPRLLLMSTSRLYPKGLANSSGLVGKYLTEHLDAGARARFVQPLEPWKGVPISLMVQDYYETRKHRAFARGWLLEVSTAGNWPIPVARRVGGWGKDHKARMKERFGHELEVFAQGEQIPDIRNQVTLDPDVRDSFGLPVPRLESQPRGNDLAMLKAMERSLIDLLEASGASQIVEAWSHRPGASIHYMGTCRMGNDARTSVVDRWGRTHDVPNLFITDSSVFVTGGAAHPTLTLMALAARTAEYMVKLFKRGDL